ncbi:hypothetical protein JB92DRAFT_2834668 [Gautieria morchelliformis]|nr:hypothetical protein JB92DRAFT_2834668 [Gautieria morchelliformis]
MPLALYEFTICNHKESHAINRVGASNVTKVAGKCTKCSGADCVAAEAKKRRLEAELEAAKRHSSENYESLCQIMYRWIREQLERIEVASTLPSCKYAFTGAVYSPRLFLFSDGHGLAWPESCGFGLVSAGFGLQNPEPGRWHLAWLGSSLALAWAMACWWGNGL